jgi:hypothetical protein
MHPLISPQSRGRPYRVAMIFFPEAEGSDDEMPDPGRAEIE